MIFALLTARGADLAVLRISGRQLNPIWGSIKISPAGAFDPAQLASIGALLFAAKFAVLVLAQLQHQELETTNSMFAKKGAAAVASCARKLLAKHGGCGDGNWPDIQLYRGVCDSSMTALVAELPREWLLSDAGPPLAPGLLAHCRCFCCGTLGRD